MTFVSTVREEGLCLYAVIQSADGATLSPGRGREIVSVGPIAALTGPMVTTGDLGRRALAHDRTVLRALAACSAVIPFRLGASLPSRGAVARMLERNRASLTALLSRFSGRVEMGLKIRLDGDELALSGVAPSAALTRRLAGVHRLTADSEDRRERVCHGPRDSIFEGSYLIPRAKIESFWERTAALRARSPHLPMLASGPFAPYSFCGWLHRESVA